MVDVTVADFGRPGCRGGCGLESRDYDQRGGGAMSCGKFVLFGKVS